MMKKTMTVLLVLGVLAVASLAVGSISAGSKADAVYVKVGESVTLVDSYLKSNPDALIITHTFANTVAYGVATAVKNNNTLTITGVKAGGDMLNVYSLSDGTPSVGIPIIVTEE
jgi:hypothetical protein